MPKYRINAGTSQPEYEVDADEYVIQDGYFQFRTADGEQVFTVLASLVLTVRQQDE